MTRALNNNNIKIDSFHLRSVYEMRDNLIRRDKQRRLLHTLLNPLQMFGISSHISQHINHHFILISSVAIYICMFPTQFLQSIRHPVLDRTLETYILVCYISIQVIINLIHVNLAVTFCKTTLIRTATLTSLLADHMTTCIHVWWQKRQFAVVAETLDWGDV